MKKNKIIILTVIIFIIILAVIVATIYFVKISNEKTGVGGIIGQQKELELIPIITVNENYDYNIYYYGIEDVTVSHNGKLINLKDALISNEVLIDDIINNAIEDVENGKIKVLGYLDGGTREFLYPDYTIIKCNRLKIMDNPNYYAGEKDVYIVKSGMKTGEI